MEATEIHTGDQRLELRLTTAKAPPRRRSVRQHIAEAQRCPTHLKKLKLRSGWESALLSFHSQSDAELRTAISRHGASGAVLVERAAKKKQ